MIFNKKEMILKDGQKVILRSPFEEEAKDLLNSIMTCVKESDYLLSVEEDFQKYVENIKLEENFINSFKDNQNYLICAYVENKIIGNCSLEFNIHQKDKHRAKVGIAIQKKYWNLGIGSILFDIMIEIAKNKDGIEQIELDVVSQNARAKHLYMKKGFIKTGDIPHQLKLQDGSYLDGELMVLFLK